MSTQPPQPPQAQIVEPPTLRDREVVVYSHSTLYYWWPVWAVGFVLGILSLLDGHRLAIVPEKTEQAQLREYSIRDKPNSFNNRDASDKDRDALILPEGKTLSSETLDTAGQAPRLHVAATKNYGVVFVAILLLVIVFTNVPLRGMWSLVVILLVVLISIILIEADAWGSIFGALDRLAIYINAGGYFTISAVLCGLWALAVFVFDRQVYMVFIPSQFRVCQQIGGGEQVFPTEGMTLERHRSDLFRHWFLGLGSGDMTVNIPGGKHFDMHNVLFVGRKVAMIEDLMREKSVVGGGQ